MHYKEKAFDFDEIKDVFNLIVSLLEKAIKKGVNVKAKRVQFDTEVLVNCDTSFPLRKICYDRGMGIVVIY